MTRLQILVLQPDFSRYGGAYYQDQFTRALGRVHRVFHYGPGIAGYDKRHAIEDVLKLCPFEPELICFAAGWEIEDPAVPDCDPHPAIRTSKIDIPSVMVLNKEYKKLDRKFAFIRDNGIRLVFTAHHDFHRWRDQVGVPFLHFPFAVSPELFRDRGEKKRYDLGFSGELHERWTGVRVGIRDRLFLRHPLKAPRYWGVRVFWQGRRRWWRRRPFGEDYARLINRSRMWISTPSAVDLVGTRFYEVMAARSLLFCSRSPVYAGLFEDGKHCVMFEPDLGDFDDKLFHYLGRDDEREAIVDEAYRHVRRDHTWERRIEQFTRAVDAVVKGRPPDRRRC